MVSGLSEVLHSVTFETDSSASTIDQVPFRGWPGGAGRGMWSRAVRAQAHQAPCRLTLSPALGRDKLGADLSPRGAQGREVTRARAKWRGVREAPQVSTQKTTKAHRRVAPTAGHGIQHAPSRCAKHKHRFWVVVNDKQENTENLGNEVPQRDPQATNQVLSTTGL